MDVSAKNILKDLIKIDSQCTKSNKEIVDYIKSKLSRFNIQEYKFSRDGFDLYNLIVKIPGKKSDSPLVFIGHTDTVPGSENWKGQEFNSLEKDGKIYGLGSTDMKAGLACMIHAALLLNEIPEEDIYLLFDADEEDQGQGARELLNKLSLANSKVLISEPTDRKITYAHKGCLDLIIETSGIAKHSSEADSSVNEKENAIYKANKILNSLINYEKKIEERRDPLLGKATMNIGQIEGGISANVVADKCIIKICRRLIPQEKIEGVYTELTKLVLSEDKNAKVTSTFWAPSFLGDVRGKLANEIVSIALELGLKVDFQVNPSTTEAGIFSEFGDTLVFGPGDFNLAHKVGEYVSISDLEFFSELYFRLMKKIL